MGPTFYFTNLLKYKGNCLETTLFKKQPDGTFICEITKMVHDLILSGPLTSKFKCISELNKNATATKYNKDIIWTC